MKSNLHVYCAISDCGHTVMRRQIDVEVPNSLTVCQKIIHFYPKKLNYILSLFCFFSPSQFCFSFRTWRTNIDNGKCAIVSTSIAHPEATVAEGVRATVLASRYLIEPIEPGRSRLTHVYRVDLRLVFSQTILHGYTLI